MSERRANPRLVKIHRNYTTDEIAGLFGIHKNSVRAWIKQGLPILKDKRPYLVLGADLREFLLAKRTKNKQRCKPWELYCLRCRAPRVPASKFSEFNAITPMVGNLTAICPACDCLMNKRISMSALPLIQAQIEAAFPLAPQRIGDGSLPSVNSDFGEGMQR